ncbi:hypothetical protein [Candidatus Odyssella acanthamoebae]|uniref:Uncharacterized protein n=1 Tax=Candidatus Odyssella acanthamoebae TaxID=91604 RepID=A0A077AZS6_9PROT|nr:hypothetical protein [Candidatus Paracaedibacter acanthamoebae]AIK97218.1 hypothetical protein ID47_11475 [Candidatus Paracaedibacter acanthamoebae]
MDKIILDIDCWRHWTSEGAFPLEVNCLPRRFALYLNPLLYLSWAKAEKVEWSDFQQQTLLWLEKSPHQLLSSTYLCDLARGHPQGEILTLKGMKEIQVFKNETIAFQVSAKMPSSKIQNYLKRFDIIFTPSQTSLKQPTLLNLISSRQKILPQLQRQHQAYHTYLAVNVGATILCIILAMGAAASSIKWWHGLKQLQNSETQSVLTPDQQEQASLYQDFCHLTSSAQLPDWTAYQKFLAIWRQKIVITQIVYENNKMSCSFIMHPDYAPEIDQLIEWLDQNLPGSKLTEGEERNVDFHLSFTPA